MSQCKLCRHIMPTGRTCKSPAMRRSAYCYYHHGPQKSAHRSSKLPAAKFDAELDLEPIFDPASIHLNADRILRALASNQISASKAAILFQGLQTVLASFRMPPIESRDFPPAEPSYPNEPGTPPQQSDPYRI